MKALLPELTADLSKQQQGWLTLADKKSTLFANMEKSELAIQGHLAGYETATDHKELAKNIAAAKEEAANSKDERLHFTNMIKEKLIDAAMVPEKRNAELIAKAMNKELALRKVAESGAQKKINHDNEITRFKTHFENEYSRIGTEYRNGLIKATATFYTDALAAKVKPKDIPKHIEKGVAILSEIKLDKPDAFNRILVTEDEAKELFGKIEKYKRQTDFEAAVNKLKTETFQMYAEDLKNADEAIKATQEAAEEETSANNTEHSQAAATNELVAAATPLALTGGPVVKRTNHIVLEDTPEFAMAVLANFIKNWPEAIKLIGVKSMTKLVDPFTKALDKMDKQFDNLKYEEKCK